MDQGFASGFEFADRIDLDDRASLFYTELLRGMNHKLNNQLSVIRGFSSLILMSEDLDDDSKEQLDQMVKAAKAAEELSALMLSAGGTVRPELRMLNLGDIMPMAEAKLRAPCESAGVPFQLNMQPSLPSIQGDNSRLSEILIELVRNAAEAAQGTGGEVAIDVVGPGVVDPQSRAVEVFVRNTGAAINREKIKELKDMFRPFVTTKVGNHSGLGLTNCAMLAGKMGMRLGVKAEGDTVTLWLSCPVAS